MNARADILVVDDNAINVDLVSFVLDLGGFAVRTAADGPAAMTLIALRKPDLILMDIQLPGVDGVELTRHLKADPVMQQIVIVAFTAYAMKDDQAKLLAAGFDGYLSKPINVATFADQVRQCLTREPAAAARHLGQRPETQPPAAPG
jgi:CheY-like chemotaxis protein